MTRSGRVRALALGLLLIVGQASAVSGCGASVGGGTGTGGAPGGSDAGATGGSGAGDAGGPMVWQTTFCSVARSECTGWVEDDAMGVDGTDVNCHVPYLVDNGFLSSICFQAPVDSTFEALNADAQRACETWCDGTGGFHGLYPLGGLATVAGSGVTCAAEMRYLSTEALPGQCAKVAGPSAGATEYVLCTLGGRGCASMMTSRDGTQYCTSMPALTVDQSGCFDPTTISAQDFCKNGLQFSGTTAVGTNVADEFAYWRLAQVAVYGSPADCAAAAAANR